MVKVYIYKIEYNTLKCVSSSTKLFKNIDELIKKHNEFYKFVICNCAKWSDIDYSILEIIDLYDVKNVVRYALVDYYCRLYNCDNLNTNKYIQPKSIKLSYDEKNKVLKEVANTIEIDRLTIDNISIPKEVYNININETQCLLHLYLKYKDKKINNNNIKFILNHKFFSKYKSLNDINLSMKYLIGLQLVYNKSYCYKYKNSQYRFIIVNRYLFNQSTKNMKSIIKQPYDKYTLEKKLDYSKYNGSVDSIIKTNENKTPLNNKTIQLYRLKNKFGRNSKSYDLYKIYRFDKHDIEFNKLNEYKEYSINPSLCLKINEILQNSRFMNKNNYLEDIVRTHYVINHYVIKL